MYKHPYYPQEILNDPSTIGRKNNSPHFIKQWLVQIVFAENGKKSKTKFAEPSHHKIYKKIFIA